MSEHEELSLQERTNTIFSKLRNIKKDAGTIVFELLQYAFGRKDLLKDGTIEKAFEEFPIEDLVRLQGILLNQMRIFPAPIGTPVIPANLGESAEVLGLRKGKLKQALSKGIKDAARKALAQEQLYGIIHGFRERFYGGPPLMTETLSFSMNPKKRGKPNLSCLSKDDINVVVNKYFSGFVTKIVWKGQRVSIGATRPNE